ncbi:MAG TPA: sulfite exporter TauE/SafE family protein [Nitrospira sp.]|nr:sulfite exporter TauE/SafE family protein [Nitrospira sp.]
MILQVSFAIAAVLGGAIASSTGFGIGSILTPLLSLQVGIKVAVAAVAIPHFIATGLRFWLLRKEVDRGILLHFGILSAIGGLAGALLHSFANSPVLSGVFAGLLFFAGSLELTGKSREIRFSRRTAWVAGVVSGLLGGLVGNQGGIRSAALLGFDVKRQAFVATATATGLIVDAVRMPVYLANEFPSLISMCPTIGLLSIAAVIGTVIGERTLHVIPEEWFRRSVGLILLALGAFMLYRAFP